jgi:hypothetical protein
MDSLTYASSNLSLISLYKCYNLMPPNGGIIRYKPKVRGEVLYDDTYLLF